MTATMATGPRLLSIGAVATAVGVTTETVRDYERRGILRPGRLEGANVRLYVPADVELLRAALAKSRARRAAKT
jgi:DNA-binding transcriptional MerR regulator